MGTKEYALITTECSETLMTMCMVVCMMCTMCILYTISALLCRTSASLYCMLRVLVNLHNHDLSGNPFGMWQNFMNHFADNSVTDRMDSLLVCESRPKTVLQTIHGNKMHREVWNICFIMQFDWQSTRGCWNADRLLICYPYACVHASLQ